MRLIMLVLFFLVTLSCNAFAKADFKVVTEYWDGYTNADGSGVYFEILKKIFEPEYNFKFELVPYARALFLVESNKPGVDAIIGIDQKSASELILPKYYIEMDKTTVVYDKSKNKYTGPMSLKDKICGFINDYGYEKYLNFKIVIRSILGENRDSAANLLKLGRIDYYIDTSSNVESLFERKVLNKEEFGATVEPVLATPLYVAFSKGVKDPVTNEYSGEALKKIFDAKFLKMVKSGEAESLFKKYKVDLPTYNYK